MNMSGLPTIGDIVWRKDGFGVQKIADGRFSPTYKVWIHTKEGKVCIDRFFSLKSATRFIHNSGGLLFNNRCVECQQ